MSQLKKLEEIDKKFEEFRRNTTVYTEKTARRVVWTRDGLVWRGGTYYEYEVLQEADAGWILSFIFGFLIALYGDGFKRVTIRCKKLPEESGTFMTHEEYLATIRAFQDEIVSYRS